MPGNNRKDILLAVLTDSVMAVVTVSVIARCILIVVCTWLLLWQVIQCKHITSRAFPSVLKRQETMKQCIMMFENTVDGVCPSLCPRSPLQHGLSENIEAYGIGEELTH